MTSKNIKCPFCSGYRIGQGNSLSDKFPEVASEWDYEKNAKIRPDTVSPKSHKLGHLNQSTFLEEKVMLLQNVSRLAIRVSQDIRGSGTAVRGLLIVSSRLCSFGSSALRR